MIFEDSKEVELNNLIDELTIATKDGRISWIFNDNLFILKGNGYNLNVFNHCECKDEDECHNSGIELSIYWKMLGTTAGKSVYNIHTEKLYEAIKESANTKQREKDRTFSSAIDVLSDIVRM